VICWATVAILMAAAICWIAISGIRDGEFETPYRNRSDKPRPRLVTRRSDEPWAFWFLTFAHFSLALLIVVAVIRVIIRHR
jgi:hypothetical protein